jgi:hypothetical protein
MTVRAIALCRLNSQSPMANVSINDVVADRILLDTGGAGPFMLFDYFSRRNPDALRGACAGDTQLFGVGGSFDAEICTIKHFVFGQVDFRDFAGYHVTSAQAYDDDSDGIIGPDLLSLFTLGLDYTNARVYLTPNSTGRLAGLH